MSPLAARTLLDSMRKEFEGVNSSKRWEDFGIRSGCLRVWAYEDAKAELFLREFRCLPYCAVASEEWFLLFNETTKVSTFVLCNELERTKCRLSALTSIDSMESNPMNV